MNYISHQLNCPIPVETSQSNFQCFQLFKRSENVKVLSLINLTYVTYDIYNICCTCCHIPFSICYRSCYMFVLGTKQAKKDERTQGVWLEYITTFSLIQNRHIPKWDKQTYWLCALQGKITVFFFSGMWSF